MKRRQFLKIGGGAAAALAGGSGALTWSRRARAQTVQQTLYITDGFIDQPDGQQVYFRGYSTASSGLDVPARPMIVQEGDTIEVTLVNTLGSAHSFVIDGVVDSGTIAGGATQTVSFAAPAAGSYLFYDSVDGPMNRLAGLHGGLAVMPAGSANELYAGSPTFVQQYFWVVNDIDPRWHEAARTGSTPPSDFVPRYFTLNGQSSRPPGASGAGDPAVDAMANPDTKLTGHIGDRALIRVLNAGLCTHSVHWHANHVEWLTANGQVRPAVWLKDIVPLRNNRGAADVIYPFEPPPDAWPQVTTGTYPMHLHDEMSQTAGGGSYLFGAMTDIHFE